MASICPLVSRALGVVTIAAFLVAPVGTLRAQDFDPVLARVNGVDIRQSDLILAEEEIGANMPNLAPDKKRAYLVTYVADIILLAQAAEQQKMGDRPDVKRRLAFERNKVLMEALLQSVGDTALTDEAMHKVYEEAIKQMPPEEEVHARHILVPSEDEAKVILAELKKGADFVTVAKEKSKDPAASEGGDLGYFTKGQMEQMAPEIAEIVFKLDKGQLSDPIHTQFGWHVIEVEDKRVKPTPTFDELKPQIKSFIARRAQAELVTKLRSAANIERLDQPPPADPSLNPAAPTKK